MSPSASIENKAAPDRAGLQTQIIADLARASAPKFEKLDLPGAAPRLVWPADKTVTNLEGALPAPLRKRGTATFIDADSFATYVLQHRTPGTALFGDANEQGGAFHALLDFHAPNAVTASEDAPAAPAAPSWTEHTAKQVLDPTPEWKRWLGISGKVLDQRTFAEFIEDNAADVIVPEGAAGHGFPTQQELMSVASTLQVKTDVQFASAVRLQNGQVQIGYTENIQGGHGAEGKMPIPERFGLGIAPFRGSPKYLVTARLRYRGQGGKASFAVEIERPHKIVESAFNDVRAVIESATSIKVLVGAIVPQTRPVI